MGIELFKHNQIAYEAAQVLLRETGRAAVIHPTGTGKSFIAFKLAEEHPDSHICWLAPSEYIFRTQLENLQKATGGTVEDAVSNITFVTYSKLMRDEDMIESLKPDYIILDEFHRCGARQWGKSVKKLLETYPHANILGLSATNIRYLDNQRDMAQEIFDGQIASEMTLGESIAKGILPAPVYVISLYSYQEELKKWKKRVAGQKNQSLRAENEEILQKLRRALENADGLDQVFARHMQKKTGKYIVFCADKEHMAEMQGHAEEWFHLVDKAPHIYTAYYDNPEISVEFAAFKEDNSNHLKLLYCIDMLNEGVHVDDIDGVILLRPTVSPILYLQQIGRSLAAGKKQKPLIFDIVNNYDSLCCIDVLQQEMKDALTMMPCSLSEKQKLTEQFLVIDEVRECRKLFEQLNNNLCASWETYYLAASDYYAKHGDLRISKSYVTSTGLSLGNWLQTQRRVYAGKVPGNLTPEKVEKLNRLGMVWDVSDANWNQGYQQLKAYYEVHGNVDVKARYIAEDGYPLGKWVSNIRQRKKGSAGSLPLSWEQIKQLDDLGMIWEKPEFQWERNYRAAASYYQEHGDLRIPCEYVTEDGIKLGSWIQSLRSSYAGKKTGAADLTEEQKQKLDAIGMEWEKDSANIWKQKYALAERFYQENGHLDVPYYYCVDGVKLGKWISQVRLKRENPHSSGLKLSDDRIRALDCIGMDWSKTRKQKKKLTTPKSKI